MKIQVSGCEVFNPFLEYSKGQVRVCGFSYNLEEIPLTKWAPDKHIDKLLEQSGKRFIMASEYLLRSRFLLNTVVIENKCDD